MMISRFVLVVLLLGTVGCSSATYIHATAMDNPLDQVERRVPEEWSIERVDANTLYLSNSWPFRSIFSLGYTASHANLVYDPTAAVLHIQYYLKCYCLVTLFIPHSHDAESPPDPRMYYKWGRPTTKASMNEEINVILMWSGASVISRRAVRMSEIFPPPSPISSPSTN